LCYSSLVARRVEMLSFAVLIASRILINYVPSSLKCVAGRFGTRSFW
jgi:hypothetical protein